MAISTELGMMYLALQVTNISPITADLKEEASHFSHKGLSSFPYWEVISSSLIDIGDFTISTYRTILLRFTIKIGIDVRISYTSELVWGE